MAICPDCGSQNCKLFGRIPATDVFAGRRFPRLFSDGFLYRCKRCYLGFRWPRISKDQLNNFYVEGNENSWIVPSELRRDWAIARGWISALYPPHSKVLDVGCFDGGFLNMIGDNYERHGIEIHPIAQSRLVSKGVNFFGSDIDSLNGAGRTFDCITAFDLIEHVESPKKFLSQCIKALKTNGKILISTGNMDAPTFQLMGSNYWYCTVAEHISFVSPEWCFRLAKDLGLHVAKLTTFAHGKTAIESKIKETLKNILYITMPIVFCQLRRRGWGKKNAKENPGLKDHPPGWASAKDHFMVLLRR